jgi:hypothetical protein
MPRRPQKRVKSAKPSRKVNPPQPNGDDVKLLNSSDLRKVNESRRSKGKPPINIKPVIKAFSEYMRKTGTVIKKYGLRTFPEWVESMLQHVKSDHEDSWMFAVRNGTALAFTSCEVMKVDFRTSRHTRDCQATMPPFIYISNVCSREKGLGKRTMDLLIKQQLARLRAAKVRGTITVMLNFTTASEYLGAYYTNMGFQTFKKLDSFRLSSYAKAIEDSVHRVVMYKNFG